MCKWAEGCLKEGLYGLVVFWLFSFIHVKSVGMKTRNKEINQGWLKESLYGLVVLWLFSFIHVKSVGTKETKR